MKIYLKFTKRSTIYRAWLWSDEGKWYGVQTKKGYRLVEFTDAWTKKSPEWIDCPDLQFYTKKLNQSTLLKVIPEIFL